MIEKTAKNRIFTVLSGLVSLHLKFVWIILHNLRLFVYTAIYQCLRR